MMARTEDRAVVKLVLHGASGRMGRSVAALAVDAPGVELAAAIELRAGRALGTGGSLPVLKGAPTGEGPHVVVDFSQAEGLAALVRALRGSQVPLVSGTTGLRRAERELLEVYCKEASVFYDSNMSYGISLLKDLAAKAARALGPDADIEIVETHHNAKKDVPSGTAVALAESITPGRGFVMGRGDGTEVARPRVHVHALRLGAVPGDHSVQFGSGGEVITLSHRAISRDVFARGALRAARFIADQPPGLYSMADLIRGDHA